MENDPARIDITFSPRRVYKRKFDYIKPLEAGGGTQRCYTLELRAEKKTLENRMKKLCL